jgi:hypothetical protein
MFLELHHHHQKCTPAELTANKEMVVSLIRNQPYEKFMKGKIVVFLTYHATQRRS